MKNFISHHARTGLLFLIFGLIAQSGWGQTDLYWDANGATTGTGGTGTWNTAGTWRSGSATGTLGNWVDGSNAIFQGTAGTVTIPTTTTITTNNITFSTTGYIVTGATSSGKLSLNTTNKTITVSSGVVAKIGTFAASSNGNAVLAGTGGMTIDGSGELILAAGLQSSLSGGVTVQGNSILTCGDRNQTLTTVAISAGSGSTGFFGGNALTLNNGTVRLAAGSTPNAAFSGVGSITVSNTGTFVSWRTATAASMSPVLGGSPSVTLNSGSTLIATIGGNTSIGPNITLGNLTASGNFTLQGSTATAALRFGTINDGGFQMTLLGGGTSSVTGINPINLYTTAGSSFTGSLVLGNSGGTEGAQYIPASLGTTAITTGNITVYPNSQLSHALAGNFGVAASTLTLYGNGLANTGGAITTTNAGTTTWLGATVLGANTTITPGASNILELNGNFSGAFQLTKSGAGTLTLNGTNASNTSSTLITNGTVTVNSGSSLGTGALAMSQSAGVNTALNLNESQSVSSLSSSFTNTTTTFTQVITIASGKTLTVNQSTNTTYGVGSVATLSSTIAGAGNLIKSGAGILTFTSVNTHTGTTTINGGTLTLSGAGSNASSSAITVGSGGTFDVSGLTTALTLGASQTLRGSATGSNTTGTIKVATSKNFTLSAGGLTFSALAATTTPPLTVDGTGGNLVLVSGCGITVPNNLTIGTYKLIAKSGNGATVSGTAGTLTYSGSTNNTSASVAVTSGELVLTVIATPTLTAATLSSAISNTYGTASSGVSFSAEGSDLTSNITATAQTGFAVSTDNSTFSSSVSVESGTTVYVQSSATKAVGAFNGVTAVVLSDGGAASSVNITTSASGNAVSAKALSVTASAQTKTAGASSPTTGTLDTHFTVSGLVNSDTANQVTLSYSGSPAGNLATATAGNYTITPSVLTFSTGSSSNYSITYNTGSLTINAATSPTLTAVTLGTALSSTYGTASTGISFAVGGFNLSPTSTITATPQSGYEISSTQNGTYQSEAISGIADGSTLYVRFASTKVAGSYNGVTAVVLSGGGATSDANVTTAASSNIVSPKALTITGAAATNRAYNGSTTVAVFGGTLSGVLSVDNANVTLGGSPSGTVVIAAVGNSKAVTVSSYSISGSASVNYSLTQPTDVTVNITQASLTITASDVNKVAGVALTGGAGSTAFTSSGLQNSETIGTVTIAYGAAGAATGDGNIAGVYASQVTPSAATAGSFTASNYSISYVAGSIRVLSAPVTLAAWDFNGYANGGSSPQSPTTTNSNLTIVGLTRASGLTVISAAANAWGTNGPQTSPTNAATAITANSFITFSVKSNSGAVVSLNGIAGYNVRRSSTGYTSGQWQYSTDGTNFSNIGSAITWGSTTSAPYNSQVAIDLSSISAIQNLTSSTTVTFRIALWGATGTSGSWYLNEFQTGNDFIVSGYVLTAPILSTPTSASLATTSATLGATITSDGGATVTARGTVWGTAAAPTGNSLAEGGTAVEAFSHSRTGLTANTLYYYRGYATNSIGTGYSADGTFTSLPLAPTVGSGSSATTSGFTASWSHPTMGSASYTYTVEVDNDNTFGSIDATVSSIASSNTSTAITGLSAGTIYYYRVKSVNAGGTSSWSGTSVAYATTPSITVTVGTYTYNGSTQGPTAVTGNSGSGTVTWSYVGTGSTSYASSATLPTAAGTYSATASVAASGYYAAASSSATAFTIAKAALIVTAVNKSKTYDGAIYSGGYTSSITGFVNSETVSVVSGAATYSGTAISATNAGTYTITPAVGTLAASNYSFSFTNGTLTISKATPTLSISNNPQTYSGSQIAATVTGSVAGTVSNVKYGGSATVPTNAGTYAITANLVPTDGTNYSSLTDVSAGDFVISKATPTLTVNNTPVTYDGLTHAATATASGDGTVSNILTGGAATQTNAGTYTVTADIAASSNYNAASGVTASNSFVISKASSSITVTGSTSFIYSGSAQGPATSTVTGSSGAVSYSYSGVSPTVYATSATAPTNVGSYTVIASVAADSNYEAASSSATAFGIVYPTNDWIGANSTSWNDAGNWSLSRVPLSTDNITISTGSPVLDISHTIDAGRTLTLTSAGPFNINPNKILTIAGTANFGDKSVIIKSDASGDGAIGQVTGTLTGATNVTVERYIPGKRAWRLLTAPLQSSANTSIFSMWQNNGSVISDTGVELWGPGGTTTITGVGNDGNGIFSTPTLGASIKEYVGSAWQPVTTSKDKYLYTSSGNNAYAVFVTGGYGSNNISNGQYAATTLKATGELIKGNVTFNLSSTSHTLIGNPYASPLSPAAVLTTAVQTDTPGLFPYLWVWDPQLSANGGYVLYDGGFQDYSGSYSANTAIQSGQAFFVRTDATGGLTLNESMKSTSVTNTFRNNSSTAASIIRVAFSKQTAQDWMPVDGCIAGFYEGASAAVDWADGRKMNNSNENIAFVRSNLNLSSEHYPLVTAQDILYLKIWNAQQAHYKLRLNTQEYAMAGVEAYLQDLYTGTSQPLNLDGSVQDYEFDVDPTVSASSGNRFRIVFTNTALAVTHPEQGQLSIYPNPATGGKVTVSLPNGNFEGCSYELINVLGQVVRQDEIVNGNSSQISIPLTGLPNSWYALRIMKDNSVLFQGKLIIKN